MNYKSIFLPSIFLSDFQSSRSNAFSNDKFRSPMTIASLVSILSIPSFAFPYSSEFTQIFTLAPPSTRIRLLCTSMACLTLSGCWSELKERTYDAPKIESEFVKGREPRPPRTAAAPMMGASRIPLQDRRILGAIIPDGGDVYFVKATDRTSQLTEAEVSFRSVVELFAIDTSTGSPKLELPNQWTLKILDNANAGIGLAEMIAEFNFEASGGPIRFTVSKYSRPSDQSAWEEYLLSQINRWRGQLEMKPITVPELQKELPTIPREGASLPAILFDARGSGANASPPSSVPAAASSAAPNAAQTKPSGEPTVSIPSPPASPSALKLVYEKPAHWEIQPPRLYREATFKFTKDAKEGEVTIATAIDSPLQNAGMWIGQLTQSNDPATIESLANKAIDAAETLQVGTLTGKLYTIRASDQPDARSLMVVALPLDTTGRSLFIKLNCELRTMEQEKAIFLGFVDTLRWE